ncbi:MAG: glycosyltransferase [Erysipelotrichales bacterium]
MNIGIFTDTYSPDINGVVTSIKQLENELIKNGHTVYIITSSSNKSLHKEGNVLRVPGVSVKKLYGYKVSGFYSWFAARAVKKLKLDVIHAQTEYGIGIFARIIAAQHETPLVYTYHTMMEDYTHYVTKVTRGRFEKQVKSFLVESSKLYADRCTELIVPSYKTSDAMIRYGVKNKINVIPTGIDLSKFDSNLFKEKEIQELRKEYGINENDFLVVFIGRVAREKSVHEILEAFNYIKGEKINNIKFLVVGDGPALNDLKEYTTNNKLEDYIKFVGSVDHTRVPIFYQCGNVFVSTSTSETQGLTFIEAMASHLPVICKFDTNLEDFVLEGKTGYFIEDYKELALKLIELSSMDTSEYQLIADNAQEISKNYSSTIFYEKVMIVYESAIKNKRRESDKNTENAKNRQFI